MKGALEAKSRERDAGRYDEAGGWISVKGRGCRGGWNGSGAAGNPKALKSVCARFLSMTSVWPAWKHAWSTGGGWSAENGRNRWPRGLAPG